MNPFSAYRLHITPLSPVHIGTGESYEPTNYVIEDGALHEFDTGAAMAVLSNQDREELLRIASGKPDTQMLKALQGFFHARRKPLQAHAVNCIPVLPGIARVYDQRIGRAANTEGNGQQVINKLEIDRTAYNSVTRQPVLFGSSLKGAIRTALLNWKNQGEALQVVKDYRTGRTNKENNQALQQRLLEFKTGKFELDPLRLVQIADAHWQGEAGLPAAQVCLAVNRKKHPVKEANGQLRKAMGENLFQILECVSAWRFRAFAGQLNVQHLDGIAETDHEGKRRLPTKNLRFDMARIARACNNFYLPVLNNECKILREQGFFDAAWNQTLKQTLAMFEDKIKQNRAFLLRVGRHSGAESVTLPGARNGHIKIMRGKEQKPEYADAAKTLWLAAEEKDQRQNLLPFGWLLVEIEPWEAEVQDWPELRELCEPQLQPAREFAQKRESQREALEKARLEVETRRQEEETIARQQAEAQQAALQAQAERQAELAALSDQAQQVEAFRERMVREGVQQWAKVGNGGPWFADLTKLVEAAKSWMPEDKAALAEFMQELGRLDPRLAPKKNDKIKQLIKSLS